MERKLVNRSISSITWRTVTSWISRVILFTRAVLLARLLPVNVFGVVAFAGSIVSLTAAFSDFGKSSAFLSKTTITDNEDESAAAHFTLSLLFSSIVLLGVVLGAVFFSEGQQRQALIVLATASSLNQLMITPRRILVRRVQHRRLAMIEIITVVLSTAAALSLAYLGYELWALLAINITGMIVDFAALYVWKPIWVPRLAWIPEYIRYYLSQGPRFFIANLIYKALDRVDDIWVGTALGDTLLGFYSKAYNFALYPRQILAEPIKSVAVGVYSELAGDRKKLSQAFRQITSLLVRSGFLLAGIAAVAAPELVLLLLGEKWLPMVDVFRLMLVFTLFDPVKTLMESVFIALGLPDHLIRVRFVQLLVMLAGLFTLVPLLGNIGAALAVDLMVVCGIGILTWRLKELIDYSTLRLFLPPLAAGGIGLFAAASILNIPGIAGMEWRNALVKVIGFSLLYLIMLAILEWREMKGLIGYLRQLLGTNNGKLNSDLM